MAWKAGVEQSTAGFQVAFEGLITADGWITTASGRPRSPHPTRTAANTPFLRRADTQAASAFSLSIGGNPGQTLISAEGAADPDLPSLVLLCFAMTNEQVLLLHRPDLKEQQKGQFGAVRSPGS